jgi:polyisoprenoid-binding protein YceI
VAPALGRPICVYGADAASLEGRMAAEKLIRRGYAEVYELAGGFESWQAAGFRLDEGVAAPASRPAIADGTYSLDPVESRVRWTGRNLLNSHEGFIGLASGSLKIEQGRLSGGEVTLDLRSITCSDLAGTPLHDVLVRHLQDHDFFDVALYPEAVFLITSVNSLPEATPGAPDLALSGILTLKGVSAPVEFFACSGLTAEGKLAAQASFSIDRTRWNVRYGSGKWFRHLGGHLVNDLIDLQLRIVTA